jgi:hypothetical protein
VELLRKLHKAGSSHKLHYTLPELHFSLSASLSFPLGSVIALPRIW